MKREPSCILHHEKELFLRLASITLQLFLLFLFLTHKKHDNDDDG
jgi:hypothetical protein